MSRGFFGGSMGTRKHRTRGTPPQHGTEAAAKWLNEQADRARAKRQRLRSRMFATVRDLMRFERVK